MDSYKIDNYAKEHPGRAFPAFRHLGAAECRELRGRLATRLGVDVATEGAALLERLSRLASSISRWEGAPTSADIEKSLTHARAPTRGVVYLNWGRFDDIDEMALEDVLSSWDALFYVGPDDLDILPADLSWHLSVRHHGSVEYALLPHRPC